MIRKFYLHGIFVWLIFGLLTILLAIFREGIFIPTTGLDGTIARLILIPIPIFYIFIITDLFLKRESEDYNNKDTIILGVLWLIWTIIFEFTFGSLVMGNSIEYLIADYNIFIGRVWGLFLFSLLIAPFIVNKYILKRAQS
jgi:hypothetical protein